MLHTMQCHDQYHRYLIPCLCWGAPEHHGHPGVGQSTALLHQSHLPHCQSACLAVQQWLFSSICHTLSLLGSARTPRSPWCWPVDCPAAPEPPASLSVGLFGSTTVAIFIDMSYLVSAGERPNTTVTLVLASRLPCCTRATCLIVSRPVWQYNSVYSLMFQVRP